MADAINASVPGQDPSRIRPKKAAPSPSLAALLAELDRPLAGPAGYPGSRASRETGFTANLLARLRQERQERQLLDAARAAAERALGARIDREAQREADTLMQTAR